MTASFGKKKTGKKKNEIEYIMDPSAEKLPENTAEAKSAAGNENVLNQLVGTLGQALDDDIEEIDELLMGGDTGAKNKQHRGYFILGTIALFFTVIGVAASFVFAVNMTTDILERRALKLELTQFVYPVVITDPPEFENIGNLRSSTIIASSIWKIILFGETDNYEKDMGTMTIPAIDVEASIGSIFGYGFEITHHSIDDVEYLFDYNAETNSYIVPEKPRYMTYMPRITELVKEGDIYRVTVDYMTPNPLAGAGLDAPDEEPIKTLIYTISRSKGQMAIRSIIFPFNAGIPME